MSGTVDPFAAPSFTTLHVEDPLLGRLLVARRGAAPPQRWRRLEPEQASRALERCSDALRNPRSWRNDLPGSWRTSADPRRLLVDALRTGGLQLFAREAEVPGGESPQDPAPPRPQRPPPPAVRTWIGVRIVDTSGALVAAAPLLVVDPDGHRHRVVTDARGAARVDGLAPGICDITIEGVDGRDWGLRGPRDDGDLRFDVSAHTHQVEAGDCLSSLARRKGFRRLAPLLRANHELLALRENPNVLAPGDVVQVPERRARVESCATGAEHLLVVAASAVLLRLRLVQHQPGWRTFRIVVGGSEVSRGELSPGADHATLVGEVPADASRATLELTGADELTAVTLALGRLPPWDVDEGGRERLVNLGYLEREVRSPGAVRRAVALFQRDHGLSADGLAGPKTLAALRDAHGC